MVSRSLSKKSMVAGPVVFASLILFLTYVFTPAPVTSPPCRTIDIGFPLPFLALISQCSSGTNGPVLETPVYGIGLVVDFGVWFGIGYLAISLANNYLDRRIAASRHKCQ